MERYQADKHPPPLTGEEVLTTGPETRALVRLLGRVSVTPGGPDQRRCFLFDGLSTLFHFTGWLWGISHQGRSAREYPFELLLHRSLCDETRQTDLPSSFLQYTPSGDQKAPGLFIHQREHLHAFYLTTPAGQQQTSVIGFCLSRQRDPLEEREVRIVSTVLRGLPWLHAPLAERPPDRRMAPRLESIRKLLLNGLQRKEIAASLGLSIGTVNGYIKEIYQHYKVTSRTELFRLCSLHEKQQPSVR